MGLYNVFNSCSWRIKLNFDNNEKCKKSTNRKFCSEFEVTETIGLLSFLLQNISGKSRNNIKSLLTHREVSVDGIVISQHDFNLKAGQKVCISNPVSRANKYDKEPEIIYEDDDFIVINKQAGLVTVATDKEEEDTAYSVLTEYVRRKNQSNRIFIVHRLDRDTSGVLLVAKNEKIKLALQDDWAKLVSCRGYYAIVEGRLKDKDGSIKSWLRQTKTMLMYSSFTPGDGLEAITKYNVVKENKLYSLLDIHLESGRKNQIRVHMKDIGHSVAGDKKYGAKTNPLKRLGLHAYRLEFTNPITDRLMSFEAPMPTIFKDLLN